VKAQGLGSNSKPASEHTLEELKKTAKSRGIPLEKLIAQMVQQYLEESKKNG
jgi:predicted DNA binding CopG/RHH family protein